MNFRTLNISPLALSLVFLALAWTLPFLQWHHQSPIPSFYSEWLAFALGVFALVPLLIKRFWRPLILPRSILFLLGFLALLVLQVVLDRVLYLQQALVAALYILWAGFLMWLGNQLAREFGLERVADVLAWALVAGAALSCGIGFLQHFGVHTPFDAWVDRKASAVVIGNLGQPNHLANYLALGLASVSYLMARTQLAKWLGLPIGALFLLFLALTGSRSSWLYLGAFLGLAWLWRRRSGKDAAMRWILYGALLMLPVFACMQWLAHQSFMQGVSATLTPADRFFEVAEGLQIRIELWRESARMLLENPLLGVGLGQFAWQHFQLASAAAVSHAANSLFPTLLSGSVFNHGHNLFAQIGAEFGFSGLLLLVVGGAVWLSGWIRQPATLAGWWIAAVLAVLLLHSLLEYPLWYAYFLGVAAVLIGAVDQSLIRLKPGGLSRVAFLLMLGLLLVAGVRELNAYSQLEGLIAHRQVKISGQDMGRILRQVRQESLLAPYSDFAYALSMALDRDAIDKKVALNAAVMQFAPTQELVYRHAILLGLQGRPQAAQMMLKRALVIYPNGARKFLQLWAGLSLENRNILEPLRESANVFLQEQKQHAFYTK